MPPSPLTSNGDASDAFFDQFSTIIRLESRLNGDNSEDAVGPARQRWAVRHLAEVAEAQGFTSQLPTEGTLGTFVNSGHTQEFITPLPAQGGTSTPPYFSTPWYTHFYLADQGISTVSGPYRPPAVNQRISHPENSYRPFDPAEQAAYRAAVQAQLSPQNTQRVVTAPNGSTSNCNYDPDPHNFPEHAHPRPQLPITPSPRVRYPSTPPNRPARHHRQTPSAESLPDLTANTSLRANTEPIAESANMSSLAAPDHYEPIEVYALEVKNGDFIQSVKNPGM